jgi:hypothetical protein
MIEMNAALSFLKVISEYTRLKVCVKIEIETIKYELRRILATVESYSYRFEYLIEKVIKLI